MSVLLDKRHLAPIIIVVLSIFVGIKMHGHLRIREAAKRHGERNARVREMNSRLVAEKEQIKDLMGRIQNSKTVKSPQLAEATEFKNAAEAIYTSLQERGDLLASKEELLWTKEMEIIETRRLMSARQQIETEMAQFVNALASSLVDHNLTIPSGLASKPYVAASIVRRILGDSHSRFADWSTGQFASMNGTSGDPQFSFLLKGKGVPSVAAEMTRSEEALVEQGLKKMMETANLEEGMALLSQRPLLPEKGDQR